MHTIIETSIFQSRAAAIWSPEEYENFIVFIANNPTAGDVVPRSGGVRKIRWSASGRGKRGGVRVVCFCAHNRELWLLTLYAKNERETIPAHELRLIREAIDDKEIN